MASGTSLVQVGIILFICWCGWKFAQSYYVAFHGPLSKFPGPKLNAFTRLVLARRKLRGDEWIYHHELHLKYGDVVRVNPTELSFSNGLAWKQIYGQYSGTYAGVKTGQFPKDITFYGFSPPGYLELINANDADHARMRRNFSNAFSDRSLRQQEPLIRRYVDLLVTRMTGVAQEHDNEVDLVRMLNFTTFDIMADLTSGESLGCLEQNDYHPWIKLIFSVFRILPVLQEIKYFPLLAKLIDLTTPKSTREEAMRHYQYSRELVDKRLARKAPRPDVWGIAIDAKEEYKLSLPEMYGNSRLFMTAGTETTATLVSGLTYYLLTNPTKLEKLVREVRDRFASAAEINLDSLQNLDYLNACIEEGLRVYPPVPSGLPRIVPTGGADIGGYSIPENTAVYVHSFSCFHSPKNFTQPDDFIPERWLGDAEYASDDRACVQPFSTGPRNCIGKNLAYLEMRLLVANIVWHFDLSLLPGGQDWVHQQKVFLVWEKQPLPLHVKVASRSKPA